jgi:hypothetical protein
MKRAIIIVILPVIFGATICAADTGDVVSWARVYTPTEEAYNSLVYKEGLDVTDVSPYDYVEVVAPQSTLEELGGTGFSYEYLQYDCLSSESWRGRGYSGYHNYDELAADLTSLERNHPNLSCVLIMGNGHADAGNIMLIKLYNREPETNAKEVWVNDPNKPDLLVVGCHHAREPMSVETALSFATYMCENYATDSNVRNVVDNMETYIIPCLNVDGWIYDDVEGSRHWWRKNSYDWPGDEPDDWGYGQGTGVDLNRNYTYMWGYDDYGSSPSWSAETYRGPSAGSEPEVQIIMDLTEELDFVSAISLHSSGEWILRPWGYIDGYCSDNAKFVEMSQVINDEIYDHLGHYYKARGGWELYNTNGDLVDGLYGEYGVLAVTIELNSSSQGGFYPDDSYIAPTCDMMNDALLAWANWCVSEFASVNTGENRSDDSENAKRAFALEQNKPNPVRDKAVFGFTVPERTDGELAIYDIAGRKVNTVAEGPFDEGYNEYTADLSGLPSGVYVYRLVAGGDSAAKKIVVNR